LLKFVYFKSSTGSLETRKGQYALLLKNIYSDKTLASPTFSRTFKIDSHIESLFLQNNVVQGSFFDLYDDGYLDILLVVKDKDHTNRLSSEPEYKLIALNNEFYDDVYFLKAI
jgi:hypothetical protein